MVMESLQSARELLHKGNAPLALLHAKSALDTDRSAQCSQTVQKRQGLGTLLIEISLNISPLPFSGATPASGSSSRSACEQLISQKRATLV